MHEHVKMTNKWKTTIIARIIKYDKTILEYFQKLLPQQAL